MKFLFTHFLVTLIIQIIAFSQVNQSWIARYNGPGNNYDFSNAIVVDNAGNVYVTGQSKPDTLQGSDDFTTIKYNSGGTQQWAASYNGSGNGFDMPTAISIDNNGNVFVTGWSEGSGTNSDYATIKYNSAGVQQWVARYNGTANLDDDAQALVLDASGNVYVTGLSYGAGSNYDYVTIKYNNNGVQQWLARLNGAANIDDFAASLAVDNNGNVYVTGYIRGATTGYDFATIKYNTSGVQQWVMIYNGPANGDDYTTNMAIDSTGNVYVTGYSPGIGSGIDFATIKYTSSGVQQWVSRYNGPGIGADYPSSAKVDLSGNVFVTGYSVGSGSGDDYTTIKYNSSGVQQWVARYNGIGNGSDYSIGIVLDRYNDVYVSGYAVSTSGYDYTTIKYNNSGVQQWLMTYNGSANGTDIVSSIFIDTALNVYVTGGSTGTSSGIDFATIKYNQVTGIKSVGGQIPTTYALEQNYPNPFNPTTKIKFSLPHPSEGGEQAVKLVVYDILGKEVETLVNKKLQPGSYEAEWDGSKYPTGIYFYTLKTDYFTDTKKMALTK